MAGRRLSMRSGSLRIRIGRLPRAVTLPEVPFRNTSSGQSMQVSHGRPPVTLTTPRWRPFFTLKMRPSSLPAVQCLQWIPFTGNCAGKRGSPFSFSGMNTKNSIPTATSTVSSASNTAIGSKILMCRCGKTTWPGRRCSWTLPVRRLISSTPPPERSKMLSFLSPSSAPAITPQDLPSWITAHVHALEYFGGVPQIIVPDNLKAAVSKPCRYEPDINPTYQDFAEHYGITVIPARPFKPRDKAKVETAVLLAERWILAPLRNHTFFSLSELNRSVRTKLEDLNNRFFNKLKTTRRHLFETIDKPALRPLPAHRYVYAEWKKATVNIDHHVELDHHFYSVPYQLARKKVDIRFTSTTVEVLFKNRRVASHKRMYLPGRFTTLPEHMPKSHQRHLEWTPSRIIKWAAKNGPNTEKLVTQVLESRPHPEQGFRSSLGIIRLAGHYTPERLENACTRALAINGLSYKSVKSILKNNLDQQPLLFPEDAASPHHHNIRGKGYYQGKEEEDDS